MSNTLLKKSKLTSIQGGPFSDINRMIDLDIPEGIQISMKDSFIQLVVSLEGDLEEVHNYNIGIKDSLVIPYNTDLIRNCSLSGSKVGALETTKRVNVLRHNLNELAKGTQEKMALVDSIYQVSEYDSYRYLLSPFVELHKIGSVASSYRDAYLRINLADLFGMGASPLVDTSDTGKLRIHLELEKSNKFKVFAQSLFKEGESILGYYRASDIDDGSVQNVFTLGTTYQNIDDCPYYVGQNVTVSYRGEVIPETDPPTDPGEQQELETTIAEIDYDSSTGKVVIRTADFMEDLEAPYTQYRNISIISFIPEVEITYKIQTCELVLAEYASPQKAPKDYFFNTFTTEEASSQGTSKLNKVFQIEPNAVNAMLMFNDDGPSPLSNNVKLESYRMRIDEMDVYDRDINTNFNSGESDRRIITHDSLHYDSINRTFLNAGLPLRNLSMMAMLQRKIPEDTPFKEEDRFPNGEIGEANRIMVVASPTPVTPLMKNLQFNLTNKANGDIMPDVILFKQVAKAISL